MNNRFVDETQYGEPNGFGRKVVMLCLMCVVLMIGALIVWSMIDSREETNNNAMHAITMQWGDQVKIDGPKMVEYVDSVKVGPMIEIEPDTFDCDITVNSKSLHRGIYEAEVFDAVVRMSGTYKKCNIDSSWTAGVMEIYIPPSRISKLGNIIIDGKEYQWTKNKEYMAVKVPLADMKDVFEFSVEMEMRGSEGIFVRPVGNISNVNINGEAANPSFQGGGLPAVRNVNDRTFQARWSNYARDSYVDDDYVGTYFLVGVDRYQKVTRSIKYAFILILLTFVCVLFTEIIMHRPIPLLNYFLIGAALVLFYSLLLSFSEHISFGIAYLISSAMTILLIGSYMWRILSSMKVGLVMGGLLSTMYGVVYVMLCISTYSLLVGSLLLFVALGAMMYGSLKIERR